MSHRIFPPEMHHKRTRFIAVYHTDSPLEPLPSPSQSLVTNTEIERPLNALLSYSRTRVKRDDGRCEISCPIPISFGF